MKKIFMKLLGVTNKHSNNDSWGDITSQSGFPSINSKDNLVNANPPIPKNWVDGNNSLLANIKEFDNKLKKINNSVN